MLSGKGISGSVGSDRASPPNIYVAKDAAEMIPGLSEIFSIEDQSLRYDTLHSALAFCQGVTYMQLNGTLVVGLENTSPGSREGRKRVIETFRGHGLLEEYATRFYSAFGDSALEMADHVAGSMLRSIPKAQTAQSGHRFDGLAAAIGTNLCGEKLERLMAMHGVDESRLLDLVRRKRGIGYIALEYGVSRGIAERVHRAVDVAVENPLDVGDLREMDLTLCVHAAKSDTGAIDRYVA